jgi:hypothetical protein
MYAMSEKRCVVGNGEHAQIWYPGGPRNLSPIRLFLRPTRPLCDPCQHWQGISHRRLERE